MSGYQTPDQKKEEYRKYLERTGVTDVITKVLVTLYEEPERPVNALEYIIMKLGVVSKTNSDMDALKAENDELLKRVKDLESQIDDLKARLKTFSEESPS